MAALFIEKLGYVTCALLPSCTGRMHWLTMRQDEVKEELAQHRKDMQNMLSDRQRERRAIKEEEVQCAGAGSEEVSAALQALDFEDEKLVPMGGRGDARDFTQIRYVQSFPSIC